MSDHVERMKNEHRDLTEKRNALDSFIWTNDVFDTLPKEERALMHQQSLVMTKYLEILTTRIHRSL